MDLEKHRREHLRWCILVCLDKSRPVGAGERLILDVLIEEIPDLTTQDLRVNLDYLRDRKLIELDQKDRSNWFAELNRYGVDIVEYTVDCEPGIARPRNL